MGNSRRVLRLTSRFIFHLIVALVLGCFGGFILAATIGPLFSRLGPPLSRLDLGAFIAAAGFFSGAVVSSLIKDRTATFVWVPPLLFLLYHVTMWHNYAPESWMKNVWNNFFGGNCGESGCIYDLTVTYPFYAAVSYAFGSLLNGVHLQPLRNDTQSRTAP